jgi:hypothetical protein
MQEESLQKLSRTIFILTRVLSFLIIGGFIVVIVPLIIGSITNPVSYLYLLLVLPVFIAGFFVSSRLRKLRLIARIKNEWGQPQIIKKRDMPAIRLLFDNTPIRETEKAVDDQTWNDLNMDNIYTVIDRTLTDPGEAVLYRMLRTPLINKDGLEERNRIIRLFQDDRKYREKVQLELIRLGHQYFSNDLFVTLWGDLLPLSKVTLFFTAMTLLAVFSLSVPFIWGSPVLVLVPVAVFIANLLIHYIFRRNYKDQLFAFSYLLAFIRTAGKISQLLKGKTDTHSGILGTNFDACKKILKKTRYLFPSKDTPASSPNEIINEYLNIFFLFEVRSFYSAASEINNHISELRELYITLGEIDALQSIASYRESLPAFTEPEFFSNGISLEVSDAVYPLLENPVPASITVNRNGIIITGSNMSGKSTFLRNIGCNVLLAQTISTCLASQYKGSFFRVMTSISRTDDVIAGKSFYYVEAERILRTIRSLDSDTPTLCIIDELLSGTNSAERLQASDAILHHLLKQNTLVICATHDLELIDRLERMCDLYHFTGTADDTGLTFDYQLKPGMATTRNAIDLLEYLGYPDDIIERAKNRPMMKDT